jgi:hypothetical protein
VSVVLLHTVMPAVMFIGLCIEGVKSAKSCTVHMLALASQCSLPCTPITSCLLCCCCSRTQPVQLVVLASGVQRLGPSTPWRYTRPCDSTPCLEHTQHTQVRSQALSGRGSTCTPTGRCCQSGTKWQCVAQIHVIVQHP